MGTARTAGPTAHPLPYKCTALLQDWMFSLECIQRLLPLRCFSASSPFITSQSLSTAFLTLPQLSVRVHRFAFTAIFIQREGAP